MQWCTNLKSLSRRYLATKIITFAPFWCLFRLVLRCRSCADTSGFGKAYCCGSALLSRLQCSNGLDVQFREKGCTNVIAHTATAGAPIFKLEPMLYLQTPQEKSTSTTTSYPEGMGCKMRSVPHWISMNRRGGTHCLNYRELLATRVEPMTVMKESHQEGWHTKLQTFTLAQKTKGE